MSEQPKLDDSTVTELYPVSEGEYVPEHMQVKPLDVVESAAQRPLLPSRVAGQALRGLDTAALPEPTNVLLSDPDETDLL